MVISRKTPCLTGGCLLASNLRADPYRPRNQDVCDLYHWARIVISSLTVVLRARALKATVNAKIPAESPADSIAPAPTQPADTVVQTDVL